MGHTIVSKEYYYFGSPLTQNLRVLQVSQILNIDLTIGLDEKNP